MPAPLWRVVGARLRALQPVTVAHALVPAGIAAVGVVAGLKLALSPWEAVYSVVQSFSFGMDVLPPADAVAAHPGWTQVAWAARFGLPIATGAALLEGLRIMRQIRRPLFGMRGHAIVTGTGAVGVAVARHLVRARPVVLVASEAPADLDALEGEGIRVVVGEPRSPELLRRCNVSFADVVIAAAPDDVVNVEVAQVAQHLGGPRCVVHVADWHLRASLTHLVPEPALVCFDVNEFAAARLVNDAFPVGTPAGPAVVVGFGRFGAAVARGLAASTGVTALVVVDGDPHSAAIATHLAPTLAVEHVAPHAFEHDPAAWFRARSGPFTVVLCATSDVRNLDLAVRLSGIAGVRVFVRALAGTSGWQDPAVLAERLPGVHLAVLADLAAEQLEALGLGAQRA